MSDVRREDEIQVTKKSLGKDASGYEKFEVKDADGNVIGYDVVSPDHVDLGD